jgi:hypothetical protein
MKALYSAETSGMNQPTDERHSSEYLNAQQYGATPHCSAAGDAPHNQHKRAYVATNSVFLQSVSSSDDVSAALQQRTVHYKPDAIHVMA